jgi:anaphase-promoting complex subunit 1
LTETPDGYGELSLQAPWSVLMKVPLPAKFAISNIRNLGHDTIPRARREGGFKRVLSQGPRALRGLRNSKPRGFVDLIDDEGKMHQLQILLQPRNPHVRKILEVCRAVLPGPRGGEGILVGWWNVMQWLRLESIDFVDMEWTALTITLFSMVVGLGKTVNPTQKTHTKRKSRTGFLRSSSGAQSDRESWEMMLAQEASNGTLSPSWADNSGWKWLSDGDESGSQMMDTDKTTNIFTLHGNHESSFVHKHVKFARDFMGTRFGQDAMTGCLPTSGSRNIEVRKAALMDTFIGLHLLHEEQKLDTMMADSVRSGISSLTPILGQIAKWLEWPSWQHHYENEDSSLLDTEYDAG